LISELSRSAKRTVGNSYDVVADIVRLNPPIDFLTLVIYEEGVNWRDLSQTCGRTEMPLLLKGLEQDRKPRILTKLPRREASEDNLRDIARNLSENRLLGVCSIVQLAGGRSAHIPMMDFMCTPSRENLDVLAHLIKNLRQGRGFLLQSGRSYHYYGFRLLTEGEWKVFLGKCLLMSGFADDRYIGHQLVDGHCVLRLSSGHSKSCIPTVVTELS
jgi:hypothetical protein